MPIARSITGANVRVILAILMGGLAAGALPAAGGRRVLGIVAASSSASLDGIQLLDDQDTVLAGDRLATGPGGSALVRLSTHAQVILSSSTSVRFQGSKNVTVVEMFSGATLAEGLRNSAPVVEVPSYRIGAAGPKTAAYVVAILTNRKALVFARTGQVSISSIVSGEHRVINEGEVAEMIGDPEGALPQEKEEGQPAPSKKSGQESAPVIGPVTEAPKATTSHTGIIVLAGGAAAIAGVAAALAGHGGGGGTPSPPPNPSPSSPQ